MTRRAIPLCAGWFTGLFLTFTLCIDGPMGLAGCAVLSVLCILLGAVAIVMRVGFRPRVLLFLASFCVASAYSCIYASFRLMPLEALDGETVRIEGYVEDFSDSDRQTVTVRGRVAGIPARVLIYTSDFRGDFGDRLSVDASVSKLSDSPFFDARAQYLPDGILVTASAKSDCAVESSAFSLFGRIRRYSLEVSRKIRENVPGSAGQLLSAMVCGDRTLFSDDLRINLNRSGIGHLAAVSGLHVSIAAFAVMYICKKLRANRFLRAALTGSCVLMFVIFSGMRISAVRAGLMMALYIASTLFRRRSDPLNTVCIIGAAMTISNPFAAADSSLLLSLAGVIGVAVISKNMICEFGLRGRLAKTLCASFCAGLATLPFVLLYFNELSLISPLMNLFAIPLCTVSLILGMLFALTGCRAAFLAKLAGYLTGAVVRLSDAVSGLGFTYIPLGRALPMAVCGLAALSAAVFCLALKKKRAALISAVFSFCLVISLNALISYATSDNVCLTLLSRKDSHAAVLRKGGECIIIDSDGGLAGQVENLLERGGVLKIDAVIIQSSAESAYPVYAAMPFETENIYLPEGAYVFGTGTEQSLPDGSRVQAYGADVLISGDRLVFDADDYSCEVSFLDGLTVTDINGEKTVLKGDMIKEIRLGG